MFSVADAGAGVVALGKRYEGVVGDHVSTLPLWAQIMFALDIIIFVPIFIFINYTLGSVFTSMAMVEDSNSSPLYAALRPLDEEGGDAQAKAGNLPVHAPDGIITSSMRATSRHLYNAGGLRMYFRGFACNFVIHLVTSILTVVVFLQLPIPIPLGHLIASLALVQLHAVWVHIVLSACPNGLAFWRRLPPFGKTFNATKGAIALYWFADAVTGAVPYVVSSIVGGNKSRANSNNIFVLVALALCVVFIRMPAVVALVRVQASLIPEDEATIISFDRSFGGRVAPSVVDGKGYVSVRDALKTFSRASWVRLYKMIVKAVFVNIVVSLLIGFVVMVQLFALPTIKTQ